MDIKKRELINYLFERYYELELLQKERYRPSVNIEQYEIDSYLDYLGVDSFMLEDNLIIGQLKDGTTFKYDFGYLLT